MEKLCSVLGKLLLSPDLSSKCGDARSPGKLESTGKSEPNLTFIKSHYRIFAAKRDFMKVKIGSDFPVDSSFPGDRASLHFEERSGDTSNFPKTLHNFSTSCAR